MGNPEVALRGPWDTTSIVKVGPDRRGPRPGAVRLQPRFPGQCAPAGLHIRAVAAPPDRPQLAADVFPRGHASRCAGEARAAVLVLLRLQRLAEYPRGRLGDDPAELRCGDAGRRAGDAPGRGGVQPALERGALRLGCRAVANRRRDPPGRVRRQGLAGELLLVGPLSHAQFGRRRRLRRHDRSVGDDQPGGRRHPDRHGRLPEGLPVAGLPRALGRTAGRVLQRPHRPQPERAVDRAVHVGRDQLARRDVRGAGGRCDADDGDGLLLRGRRPRFDGTPRRPRRTRCRG